VLPSARPPMALRVAHRRRPPTRARLLRRHGDGSPRMNDRQRRSNHSRRGGNRALLRANGHHRRRDGDTCQQDHRRDSRVPPRAAALSRKYERAGGHRLLGDVEDNGLGAKRCDHRF
jgi:hypothetical protein